METGLSGLNEVVIPGAISEDVATEGEIDEGAILGALNTPDVNRILVVAQALRHGHECRCDPSGIRFRPLVHRPAGGHRGRRERYS